MSPTNAPWVSMDLLALIPYPAFLFLAGCGLLTWILLRRSNRYFAQKDSQQSSAPLVNLPRPENPWTSPQRDILAQIEREQIDIQEKARDLSGQLNSKIIVLEQLIATSSKQIERLESLLDRTESPIPVDRSDQAGSLSRVEQNEPETHTPG